MAGTSLIALIDDIASLLDDTALLTKAATKKTVGVLGDDLALNAQQVSGVAAERELPVVWAVAKGSMRNKAILVPVALALSAVAPWAVTPLLMLGGTFLCFEGFEKIAHAFLHRTVDAHSASEHKPTTGDEVDRAALRLALVANAEASSIDWVALEKEKIKGAIRTDFVLSAEIVAIALGIVADAPFLKQLVVLVGLAVAMTIGVYGLVGGIVKLDDLGLYLHRRGGRISQAAGTIIIMSAPYFMKALSIAGTVAMFLVGGGILVHRLPFAHHLVEQLVERAQVVPGVGPALAAALPALSDGVAGLLAGAVTLALVTLLSRLRRGMTPRSMP